MTHLIKKLKYSFIGLTYLTVIAQGLAIDNKLNPKTQEDCQRLKDVYKYFNLAPPNYGIDDNCCLYKARIDNSNNSLPTTEWICNRNDRIESIILVDKNISTDIPWNLLMKFEELEVLYLYNNHITGEIIGNLRDTLPNLKQLRLQNNNLSGYLPTYIPDSMKTIILDYNNGIKDSIPKEWEEHKHFDDCVLPTNVCISGDVKLNSCKGDRGTSKIINNCQNKALEDRTAALQKANSIDVKNNINTNNVSNISNDTTTNNNNNNNGNLNNNHQQNNESISEESNTTTVNKRGKGSHAVLIMTGCLLLLMLTILGIVLTISHYSRIKTREKEKNIYKGTTLYDDIHINTQASIFYSKTNNTESTNILNFDDYNSISLFNCMNRRNSQISHSTAEHKLLSNSPTDEEISFIENTDPSNLNSVEMSFSVIDPSNEILEPSPALLQRLPNTSYM